MDESGPAGPSTGSFSGMLPGSGPAGQGGLPHSASGAVVPVGFEEGTLRALCDLDCGFPLLMDRTKQSMASCRETSVFFKKRAQIEEDYGRALQKLSRERMESYGMSDGKAGSFVTAFNSTLRAHELLSENRLKMATQLHEMSEQLVEMAREVEKARKTSKELGNRLERNLVDSEGQTEKCRVRFDLAVEELERILVSKAGENARDVSNFPHHQTSLDGQGSTLGPGAGKRTLGKAIGKLKGGPKNPAQLQRMEEEYRMKTQTTSDAYRQQILATQTIRQEYFNLQLPRMLKSLKESLDEIDLGTQFHLSRYAFLFETLILNDAVTIAPPPPASSTPGAPEEGPGLKAIAESIDNREDFKLFMQNYAVTFAASGQKVLRREGPAEEGFVRIAKAQPLHQTNGGPSSISSPYPSSQSIPGQSAASSSFQSSSLATPSSSISPMSNNSQLQQASAAPPTQAMYFGVDLGTQMARDGVDVPRLVEKCAEAIETYGLDQTGIYRLSGTTSRVQRLKAKFEKAVESVDLNSDEHLQDINDISGVLKLFFRELPEPVLTHELYHGFIDAAKIENARLRHIRLHERINELPDPNYATCKYLLGHLDKVRQHESTNSMSISNLAIVFGPTLLGPPPEEAGSVLQDMQWQCKAIETILEHYAEIFVDAEEEADPAEASGAPIGTSPYVANDQPPYQSESISPTNSGTGESHPA